MSKAKIEERESKRWNRRFAAASSSVLLFAFSVLAGTCSAGETLSARSAPAQPAQTAGSKSIRLILVSETDKWLFLAAAPVAAQVRAAQRVPVIVALSSEPDTEQRNFLRRVLPACDAGIVLSSGRTVELTGVDANDLSRRVLTGAGVTDTSLLMAQSYWPQCTTVIVCSTEDPEAGIMGATLAAHMKVPFIPYDGHADLRHLAHRLDALAVERVLIATATEGDLRRPWPDGHIQAEAFSVSVLRERIISLIGAQNVRNIVLARVPEADGRTVASAWIAPYLSLMRAAPVLLIPSFSGDVAEYRATGFIKRHQLQPRSVTILADHQSIGTIAVADEERLGEFEVNVEPCSRPLEDDAAADLAVGRIPCAGLGAASTMIGRGLAREALLAQQPPRALMIAIPDRSYGPLPFAEAVSHLTAEEIKNFGVALSEFYGVASNDARVVAAATDAHLIIYEGHVSDQYLFQDPCSLMQYPQDYDEQWYTPIYESDESEPSAFMDDPELGYDESRDGAEFASDVNFCTDESSRAAYETSGFETEWSGEPAGLLEELRGMPLVVLQSCHSLEQATAQRVFELGGVAVVGTVNNIHSASGSAFIKAFSDGLFYRGDTVGEALRDARNYFLCLVELKHKRGHQETSKVQRVALSFCLWGDPELRLFADTLRPRRAPVNARFVSPQRLRISTPRYRLAEFRSEAYLVRAFPGSQVAGIVKRLKDSDVRRLAPLYFFRIPLAPDLEGHAGSRLRERSQADDRTVLMVDTFDRFVHVLHFADKEARGAQFELFLDEQGSCDADAVAGER